MKIAISGKGGVGKTTVSALLAGVLALEGKDVVAVDADPDANLPAALGVGQDDPLTPLCEMKELIAERTGTADEKATGYFKLNPKVDDIPDRFARKIGPIRLLMLGGVSKGGGGCICPATTVLKALLVHLVLGRDDALIMDMEAGIEHLGRATAQSMDALILVVDQGPWSVQTALRVRELAGDLGLRKIFAVINRSSDPANDAAITRSLDGIPVVGVLPYDPVLAGVILQGNPDRLEPGEGLTRYRPAVQEMLARIQKAIG